MGSLFALSGCRSSVVAALTATVLLAGAGSAVADVSPSVTPEPTVSGPIADTQASHAFLRGDYAPAPPTPAGYEEHEFFVSGRASIYQYTSTGIDRVAPCPAIVTGSELPSCKDLPYTTRILVKMPSNPRRFDGTVIVNPMNPSGGVDEPIIWDLSRDYITRTGAIYVGYSSKAQPIETLKALDPVRYAPLSWPYSPLSSQPGWNHAAYDGITFDVASQIGALLKGRGASTVLGSRSVLKLIMAGYSQDGYFTVQHASSLAKVARLKNGRPIYDGYMPVATPWSGEINGVAAPGSMNFGLTNDHLQPGDPRWKVVGSESPVIHVVTESELNYRGYEGQRPFLMRRPDSDSRTDKYRLWEVPGSTHGNLAVDATGSVAFVAGFGLPFVLGMDPQDAAPVGTGAVGANGLLDVHMNADLSPCDRLDMNPYPLSFVQNAALGSLERWIDTGRPAPRAARMQVRNVDTMPDPVLDQVGNALGGVRTPYLEVPDRRYVAYGTGPGFCSLDGHSDALESAALRARYGSGRRYLAAFTLSAARTVAAGFWLPADAVSAVRQARQIAAGIDAGVAR